MVLKKYQMTLYFIDQYFGMNKSFVKSHVVLHLVLGLQHGDLHKESIVFLMVNP